MVFLCFKGSPRIVASAKQFLMASYQCFGQTCLTLLSQWPGRPLGIEGTMAAGPEIAGPAYFGRTREQIEAGGFPASEAAELVAFLLGPGAAGINGRLISAQWDPWRRPEFRDRLRRDPDLGKLRRIDEQFYVRAQ